MSYATDTDKLTAMAITAWLLAILLGGIVLLIGAADLIAYGSAL